jgi:TolB protein
MLPIPRAVSIVLILSLLIISATILFGQLVRGDVIAFTQDVNTLTSDAAAGVLLVDVRSGLLFDLGLPSASDPAWSPDGRTLAVLLPHQETPTTDIALYAIPSRRFERALLVDAPLVELAWSADGAAFALVRGSGQMHIMPSAGGALRFVAYGQSPSWSPDGTQIIYNNINPLRLNNQLWTFALGDGETRERTSGEMRNWSPAWSPDGEWVAFASTRDDPQGDLYVMPADCATAEACAAATRRLTNAPGSDVSPAWSPDGTWIAFASARNGGYQVFIVRADGSGECQLTAARSRFSSEPTWRATRSYPVNNP